MKKMLPILQAYAEGKTVQADFARKGEWLNKNELYDTDLIAMSYDPVIYRIKPEPEPKYRPFKDAEECWQEMQKHQPFGWIRWKKGPRYYQSLVVVEKSGVGCIIDEASMGFRDSLNILIFADGEPFGVEEEGV